MACQTNPLKILAIIFLCYCIFQEQGHPFGPQMAISWSQDCKVVQLLGRYVSLTKTSILSAF